MHHVYRYNPSGIFIKLFLMDTFEYGTPSGASPVPGVRNLTSLTNRWVESCISLSAWCRQSDCGARAGVTLIGNGA